MPEYLRSDPAFVDMYHSFVYPSPYLQLSDVALRDAIKKQMYERRAGRPQPVTRTGPGGCGDQLRSLVEVTVLGKCCSESLL